MNDNFKLIHLIDELINNGTEAAKHAGYSERTARQIATTTLSKVYIQKFLKDRTAPILEALSVTVEKG